VSRSSGSNIRTHRRSLSASSIPVGFVCSERPDSGSATYPRPKSTSRRRPRSASAAAGGVKKLGPNHLRSHSVSERHWSATLTKTDEDEEEGTEAGI
jgi:hypothetical protein